MTCVSVVVPAYNAANFLPQALASIRAQTRPVDEILVVDDGSTDGSPELARRAGARVLETGANVGPAAARNLGLQAAKGDLVAFLDADDFWETSHLDLLVPLLERHPAAALAFSRERRIGGWEGEHPRVLPEGQAVDAFWLVLRKNFIPQMGVVARRESLLAVGGYDESMRYAEDYDLWLRLARRAPFVCTHAVTCNHRGHAEQASSRDDLLARGAYEARWHAWLAAREEGAAPSVMRRIERTIQEAWDGYLRRVWRRRDGRLLAAALSLRQFVPGSESIYRRWDRRARLLWPWYLCAAEVWDSIPSGMRRAIRATVRG